MFLIFYLNYTNKISIISISNFNFNFEILSNKRVFLNGIIVSYSFFFLLDIRIVNFICSDLCDFAIQTIHAPSFQMYTPFIRKFHVIQYHYSHASCCVYNMLYTYIRTISIFSTITEYSSVFWHHGEINYSFGRYRIFIRPYIPILFQRPILFNLSPIRESNKNSKDSIIFPTFPAKFFFHLIWYFQLF